MLAESYWLAGQHVTVDPELSAIYARTTSSGERAAATELAWWLSRVGLAVDPPTIRHGAFRDALTDPRSAAAHLELLGSRYDAAACLMEGSEEDLQPGARNLQSIGRQARRRGRPSDATQARCEQDPAWPTPDDPA